MKCDVFHFEASLIKNTLKCKVDLFAKYYKWNLNAVGDYDGSCSIICSVVFGTATMKIAGGLIVSVKYGSQVKLSWAFISEALLCVKRLHLLKFFLYYYLWNISKRSSDTPSTVAYLISDWSAHRRQRYQWISLLF